MDEVPNLAARSVHETAINTSTSGSRMRILWPHLRLLPPPMT
jgi:hypothetical protein